MKIKNKQERGGKEEKIPKPKHITTYKKNLFKTKKVQKILKKIVPEYFI